MQKSHFDYLNNLLGRFKETKQTVIPLPSNPNFKREEIQPVKYQPIPLKPLEPKK